MKQYQFSLSRLAVAIAFVAVFLQMTILGVRLIQSERKIREIDLLLDRWINARDLTQEDRLKAIEVLLETTSVKHAK